MPPPNWSKPWQHHSRWVSTEQIKECAEETSCKRLDDKHDLGCWEIKRDGGFRWKCDISGYNPEELKMEVNNDELIVTGEHERSVGVENVYRCLKRRIALPNDVKKDSIRCRICRHGRLEVDAERACTEEEGKNVVPMVYCLAQLH